MPVVVEDVFGADDLFFDTIATLSVGSDLGVGSDVVDFGEIRQRKDGFVH
jgi:hypothetical protein